MDIIKTQAAISNYFNVILRNSLNYFETYIVNFDYNDLRLTLVPSIKNAELINQIKREDKNNIRYQSKIKHKIEQSLLQAFQNKNSDITNMNLYVINNKIILTFTHSDKLFSLTEEMILAKLAAEYDVDQLGNVCRINHNFAKACRSDLFWWEIIRLKFPQYYKEKRNHNYDPRELIKGLKYFNEKVDVNNEEKRTLKYPDNLMKRLDKLYSDYHQTFKYLILEDIWKFEYMMLMDIFEMIIEIGKPININSDIEIIKKIITENLDLIESLDYLQNVFIRSLYGLKIAEELDKWSISQGKEKYFYNLEYKNSFLF